MPEKIHLTRSDIKQYGMSPVGVVTPMYIGQYCITDDNKVYFAKGLTSEDWIEASGNNDALDGVLQEIISNLEETNSNLEEVRSNLEQTNSNLEEVRSKSGDLNSLKTQDKTNLVEAINELFQNVSNGKNLIATAITDKGVNTGSDDTFETMANNISNIASINLPSWITDGIWLKNSLSFGSKTYYAGSCVNGNNIFVVGGIADVSDSTGIAGDTLISAYCDYYRADTNSDGFIGSMPESKYWIGLETVGDYIYAIGGYDESSYKNGNHRTNAVTVNHSWETMKTMPTSRSSMGSAVVDGQIHCIGGRGSSSYLNTHEVYNPSTNSWTTLSTAPLARRDFTTSVIGNKIYCIGGYTGSISKVNSSYDTSTSTWTTHTAMSTGRQFLGSAVLEGKIHTLGGQTSSSLTTAVANHECYDPATNAWSSKANLPQAITSPCVEVANGFLFVVCGYSGGSILNSIYCYIPNK